MSTVNPCDAQDEREAAGLLGARDFILSIPLRDLLLVLPYMADEHELRQALCGVRIEPHPAGGCLLIATNGHVMGVVHSAGGHIDQPRTLNVPCAARDWLSRDETIDDAIVYSLVVRTENSNTIIAHANGDEEFAIAAPPFLAGTYPDWRKPLPAIGDLAEGLGGHIAARYVGLCSKLLQLSAASYWHHREKGAAGVHVARYHSAPELVVCVMPLRGVKPLPEWSAWMVRA